MADRSKAFSPAARTFDEFWLAYLHVHDKSETRAFHYAAAGFSLLGVVVGMLTASVSSVVIGLVVSYGVGVLGHVLFGKNPVIVQGRVVWSLACCYRMTFSALTGHLDEDMARLER